MRAFQCASVLVVLMWIPRFANAEEFAVTGQTCVPDDAATLADNYINTLSYNPFLTWRTVETGTITLHCAIPDNVVAPSNIELYFSNNTQCTGCQNNFLRVTYLKMNKSTGFLTTVKTLTTGAGNFSFTLVSTTFSDVYDASQFVYFLRVEISRTTNNIGNQEYWYAVVF
jgi:hypothetical protein